MVAALASALFALGPVIAIAGQPTAIPAPYAFLYAHVPGFDGLRVPARFAMLTACCLAVAAGFGVRDLLARTRRGPWIVAVAVMVFLIESTGAPIALNARMNAVGYENGPRQMFVGPQVPDVYRFAATLPPSAVIAEFPFGPTAWELQYVFYQPVHHHPIVNGYSGGFPDSYLNRKDAFTAPAATPAIAWRALASSGATHVIVHRAVYRPGDADGVEQWLVDHGAALLRTTGTDRVYVLGRR